MMARLGGVNDPRAAGRTTLSILCVLASAMLAVLVFAPSSAADPKSDDDAGRPFLVGPARYLWQWISDGVKGAGEGIAAAGENIIAAGVAWLGKTLLDAVQAILGEFEGFVEASTRPHVTAASFIEPGGAYHTVASLSAVLLVGFLFLGVIQALTSGEPGQVLFRLLRDTPVAVLAIIGFPWLVDQLLTLADAFSEALLPSGSTLRDLLGGRLAEGFGPAVGLAYLLMGLLAFLVMLLVYAELIVREVLIYLVVAMAPLSYAAFVWPAARGAARKVAEFVVAAILAKPAIFLALRVGLDLVGEHADTGPLKGAAWGNLLVGLAVVLVAAFTPWIVWRLLPHAEGMMLAQGVSRGPVRGAMQALQTAYWVGAIRSRAGAHRMTGGGGGAFGSSGGDGPEPTGGRPDSAGPKPSAPRSANVAGAASAGVGGAGGSGFGTSSSASRGARTTRRPAGRAASSPPVGGPGPGGGTQGAEPARGGGDGRGPGHSPQPPSPPPKHNPPPGGPPPASGRRRPPPPDGPRRH